MKNKKKFIILTSLFIGYLVFNGILLLGHELWRDEANVWLLARDTSPLELIRVIKYQGHPCLWYYIVMPFAKLGFPFQTICVLSFAIMAVTAGIFVFKAPFHYLTKFVCLFSPIFTYYYSVVARNYCLIALLLVLLAYVYPKRNHKPLMYGLLLGLMVQADTIAIPVAGLISCMWLWEGICKGISSKNTKPLLSVAAGVWIPLASLGFWFVQFAQVSDSPAYKMEIPSISALLPEIRNFVYIILTRMTGQGTQFDQLLILLFVAASILLAIAARTMWPLIVVAGGFLFEAIFSIIVYQLHIWHYIAIGYMLLWGFWLFYQQCEEESVKDVIGDTTNRVITVGGKILAEVMLILLGVTMFLRWNAPEESSSLNNAWNGIYSDGVNVAEYIGENIEKDAVFAYTDVACAATVQAYLGKEYDFRYAATMDQYTYANYTDEQKVGTTCEEFVEISRKEFPDKEGIYLLLCSINCIEDIEKAEERKWVVCYTTGEMTARGEEYTLYYVPFERGVE